MSAWRRLTQLPSRLNRRERTIALILAIALVVIGVWQFIGWRERQSQPAHGGTYVEALIGQPQLLNPLVTLDANDRAILSLIFPGLTKTSATGETEPVLAESWEMQSGGQSWRFTLKDGLVWHDGEAITTSDVAETVQRVVDPQQKSPYKGEWDNVTVEVIDDRTLIFHLPQPNATFLVSTNLPIIPLHIGAAELQQKLIGSGPFSFKRSTSDKSRVSSIELISNPLWPDGEPYIATLLWRFYETEDEAIKAYRSGDATGILLNNQTALPGQERSFTVQRTRAIFANTSREVLRDEAARRQVIEGGKASDQALTLIVPTTLADYQPLQELVAKWAQAGQTVNVVSLEPVTLFERIDTHDYDLVLVEVDLRADYDLYPMWHSTQKEDGLNLAQLDDKQIDEWLEQAHASADAAQRKQLAGQINERASTLGAWRQIEQVKEFWYTQEYVKGIQLADQIVSSAERFSGARSWFLKTRVSAK
jgi:ABC-type transport system substrate-binding protein